MGNQTNERCLKATIVLHNQVLYKINYLSQSFLEIEQSTVMEEGRNEVLLPAQFLVLTIET